MKPMWCSLPGKVVIGCSTNCAQEKEGAKKEKQLGIV